MGSGHFVSESKLAGRVVAQTIVFLTFRLSSDAILTRPGVCRYGVLEGYRPALILMQTDWSPNVRPVLCFRLFNNLHNLYLRQALLLAHQIRHTIGNGLVGERSEDE